MEKRPGSRFERFDPAWGGNPPLLFVPVLVNGARRAQNPRTGEILPATYIGLIAAGTGYTCNAITPQQPCQINGIVTQNDPTYIEGGGGGFNEPLPIQFDPRFGMAWAVNPKTVIRVGGGSFHDGTGGVTFKGGPAYLYNKEILYTDMSTYLGHQHRNRIGPERHRRRANRPRSGLITSGSRRPSSAKSAARSWLTSRM